MKLTDPFVLLALVSPLACTFDADGPSVPSGLAGDDGTRDLIADILADRTIDLAQAIENAENETGGRAIEARLELREDAGGVYAVDVFAADMIWDVELGLDDVMARENPEVDEADEEDARDATLAEDANWSALIGAAEREAGGTAFEIEANGDEGVFEAEVLVDATDVWRVAVDPEGAVIRARREEGDAWADDQNGF